MRCQNQILALSVALLIFIGGAAHAQELIDWINWYRAEAGQALISEIADARLVAYHHNALVLEADESGHYYTYRDLREALGRAHVEYDYIGEAVIYFGWHEVRWDYILSIFRASPPHWDMLMNPRYQYMSYNLRHTGTESAITVYMIDRE